MKYRSRPTHSVCQLRQEFSLKDESEFWHLLLNVEESCVIQVSS